jgi:hypothetical protein
MFDQRHGHTVRQRHDGRMDRPNTELARAIDEALITDDVRAAATLLAKRGVPFAVICRVLGKAARRRSQTGRTGQIAGLTVAKLP